MSPASPSPIRILIADDDPDVLAALRLLLRGEGFQVETATSPGAVLRAIEHEDFDVALLDLNYARDTTTGREGLELVSQLQAIDATLPTVVMTAGHCIDSTLDAVLLGTHTLDRPGDGETIPRHAAGRLSGAEVRRRDPDVGGL